MGQTPPPWRLSPSAAGTGQMPAERTPTPCGGSCVRAEGHGGKACGRDVLFTGDAGNVKPSPPSTPTPWLSCSAFAFPLSLRHAVRACAPRTSPCGLAAGRCVTATRGRRCVRVGTCGPVGPTAVRPQSRSLCQGLAQHLITVQPARTQAPTPKRPPLALASPRWRALPRLLH